MGGSLPVALAIAVTAGVVSFASPCVLPLVPGFLGYVTGLSELSLAERARWRMVLGALLFVLGFSAVFLAGIFLVSTAGRALAEHRELLTRLGGLVVIALAFVFLGAGAQREFRLPVTPAAGLLGAPLLGATFGLSWAPCTGPTLAAVFALATTADAGAERAIALAVAYCVGLGLPFVLVAAGVERARGATGWLRRHQRGVQLFGGGLLLVVGVLLLTGIWEDLNRWLQSTVLNGMQVPL